MKTHIDLYYGSKVVIEYLIVYYQILLYFYFLYYKYLNIIKKLIKKYLDLNIFLLCQDNVLEKDKEMN